jgi:hypothetical protein
MRMKLAELAYACSLYSSNTSYDASLDKLRKATWGGLDPFDGTHRAALLVWLNAWGCRQFTKNHHLATASPSLLSWARMWVNTLPPPDLPLTRLSDAEIHLCGASYEALRDCAASVKRRRSGTTFTVTFGPTGAAKTLFALRPNVFAPWDESIRAAMGWDHGAASFRKYLCESATALRALCSEAGIDVEVLPALVGRPRSSPPKLIDEYNWVFYTRRWPRPSAQELASWRGKIASRRVTLGIVP